VRDLRFFWRTGSLCALGPSLSHELEAWVVTAPTMTAGQMTSTRILFADFFGERIFMNTIFWKRGYF
jgi:hypothetical protein